MQKHERPNPETDPFRPPAIPVEVCCLHCGHEYESYLIEWRNDAEDPSHGYWCCPTEGCDGRGFGFDIFPTDPEYRDEHGHAMWIDAGYGHADDDTHADDEDDDFDPFDAFSQDDEVITEWGDPTIANPFVSHFQHRDELDPPQGFEDQAIRPIRLDKDGNPIDEVPTASQDDVGDLPF